MAGKTDDNIEELEILTYDGTRMRVGETGNDELENEMRAGGRRGEIYRGLKALRDRYVDLIRGSYPDIPRRVSGYNLPWLLPEKGFHVRSSIIDPIGCFPPISEYRNRLDFSGIGRDTNVSSSKIGLAHPPNDESNPFRLRITFIYFGT